MTTFKLGIIGAGWIADQMGKTITPIPGYEVYAIASRSLEKAQAFAQRYGCTRIYDSYDALVQDPDVDLVYIATPHSHHYAHTRLALEHGKPCLVEKAFTANAAEATQLLDFAHQKGIFITEAIWTRYMPLSRKIKEIMDSGVIGQPQILQASLCYNMKHKQRIFLPELAGGALLDVGVYALNFARMYFGTEIVRQVSNCVLGPTGMDMQECVSLTYADGKMANLQSGALCLNDRRGIISGTEGYISVDNINCPGRVEVWRNYELVATYDRPIEIVTGYEYQVFESKRCIEAGLLESPMMPHAETLSIMQQMDSLRREWGVRYPMDR